MEACVLGGLDCLSVIWKSLWWVGMYMYSWLLAELQITDSSTIFGVWIAGYWGGLFLLDCSRFRVCGLILIIVNSFG